MVSGPGHAMFRGAFRRYPQGRMLLDVQTQWKLDMQAFLRIRYESLYSGICFFYHTYQLLLNNLFHVLEFI